MDNAFFDNNIIEFKTKVKENCLQLLLCHGLYTHELVKVRFTASKDEVKEISSSLEAATSSKLIAITGFTAVFFRQDPESSERIYRI